MFCSKCGRENKEGALFCEYCGSPLAQQAAPQPAAPVVEEKPAKKTASKKS